MESWYELEQILLGVVFTESDDALIWQHENKGVYSTSSLYSIINFRGVIPVFIPSIWSLLVPPKIHIFLWLMSHNKMMTRDNMQKREMDKPLDCVFCKEKETITHLFHECVVAKEIWASISASFGAKLGDNLESVSRFWVSQNKNSALNTICACTLWCIWKTRNSMIFDNHPWLDIKQILWMILKTLRGWSILSKEPARKKLELFLTKLSAATSEPHLLAWG